MPGLKKPDSLPRFLTDDQVRRLRDDLEEQLTKATTPARIRMCRLDLAAFYLLWQGGLRPCELEDLTLEDLSRPPAAGYPAQQGGERPHRLPHSSDGQSREGIPGGERDGHQWHE